MKNKDVAGILALILGGLGVHQFYLGNKGKGILHLILASTGVTVFGESLGLSWIIAWITAIVIFSMGQEEFDLKYNGRNYWDRDHKSSKPDFERKVTRKSRRNNRRDDFEEELEKRWKYPEQKKRKPKAHRRTQKKPNPYKQSGIQKFKEYDYDGAIEEFTKALEIDASDIATHFNLACAYSLNENAEKAFYHLDKAVANGFKDFPRIKEHDALAYLRIQEEFDEFVENKYQLPTQTTNSSQIEMPKEDLLSTQPDLLEQLKKLGELKEKGLLTEAEFSNQKRKLLG